MKQCNTCKEYKDSSDYYPRAARCKACTIAASANWKKNNREAALAHQRQSNKNRTKQRRIECSLRRKRVRQATPSWADQQEIKHIYTLAQERGLVVDHIVPLKHELVCGLHVQDNLRCITPELNGWKSNKFNQDFLSSFGIRGVDKLMELRK